jgi:hypothetical protein
MKNHLVTAKMAKRVFDTFCKKLKVEISKEVSRKLSWKPLRGKGTAEVKLKRLFVHLSVSDNERLSITRHFKPMVERLVQQICSELTILGSYSVKAGLVNIGSTRINIFSFQSENKEYAMALSYDCNIYTGVIDLYLTTLIYAYMEVN